LVLLDKLIKVDAEKLKNQAKMLTVDESILETQQVVVVVLVELRVELAVVSAGKWRHG
jgi:hypothetical protein